MDHTIQPGPRTGTAAVPPSKSLVHRLLIAAAFSDAPVRIALPDGAKDAPVPPLADELEATVRCLASLGAVIVRTGEGFAVTPVPRDAFPRADENGPERNGGAAEPNGGDPAETGTNTRRFLPCGESASTLRFLLPAAGALGSPAAFAMEEGLAARPAGPLLDALRLRGMTFERNDNELIAGGKLTAGEFEVPGNVSSQFASGLLLALPLLSGDSVLRVTGPVESAPYVAMTERVLLAGGIRFDKTAEPLTYYIPGGQRFRLPETAAAERDWSAAAVFLAMGAGSKRGVAVKGLDLLSAQGDRTVLNVLARFGARPGLREQLPAVRYGTATGGETETAEIKTALADVSVKRGTLNGQTIDAADIPDLVPVIAAVAAASKGETRIVRAERLRIKESDRLRTTAEMLRTLGADIEETEDGLVIRGRKRLRGGTVDSAGDHRIAMAAAVAAAFAEEPVTVRNAECTDKSFPGFWEQLERLEGER